MITNKTKLGSELSRDDQRYVLAAFVHRYTGQHTPDWATRPMPNGKFPPVQFRDDAEWLANTRFAVTSRGDLDNRFNQCRSNPTWPENPELRKSPNA